jgi:ribonuclease P protein component
VTAVRHRLTARQRLRSKSDFQRAFDRKASAADDRLIVFTCENGLPLARLGVSVSRRHGNAVVRNRIKRLFREAFRLSQHELPLGVDFVLVPKAGALDHTLSDWMTSLQTLVTKANAKRKRTEPPS